MTATELDKECRKEVRVKGGYAAEGWDIGFHEGTGRTESLSGLHVSVHNEQVTVGHEPCEGDIFASGLELNFAKNIEQELEEFCVRTIDVGPSEGDS